MMSLPDESGKKFALAQGMGTEAGIGTGQANQITKGNKMFTKTTATLAAAAMMLSGAAWAETFEVTMLNKGEAGTMVFEPAFIQIAPGDTVKFVATDKGHNAQSIDGMMPEGAEEFKGKINQEIEVTLDKEGLYGVQCLPHFAMGMVMTIAVGENVEMPDDFLAGRLPKKAKERFEEQVGNL